jgi:uncharacterized protein YecE (DUF72 family)
VTPPGQQDDLFASRPRPAGQLKAAPALPEHLDVARRLPASVRLGTSSWSYPGWQGLIWADELNERRLAKDGLTAYSQHPLMRTVSVDRSFYQALSVAQYARYASQVPDGFRFIVKAPASVSDALIRGESGRAKAHNPLFLDPELALREFIEPAVQGLGHKVGALVFQISPLPHDWLRQPQRLMDQLEHFLGRMPAVHATCPGATIAVEVRDAALVNPQLAQVLKRTGHGYCLGLHARMPPIEDQLPLLRCLWPGPLVCRWNLHRKHGAFGYEAARSMYAPFDHIQDADPQTRHTLARVIVATARAGLPVHVSISNKAEGCAPLSVGLLAQEVLAQSEVGEAGAAEPAPPQASR